MFFPIVAQSLFQAALEVSNTMWEEFKCTVHEVICDKADRTLLTSDDRYSDTVQETKETRRKKGMGYHYRQKTVVVLNAWTLCLLGTMRS